MNVQHDKDIYSVVDSLCSIALEICHQTVSTDCHLLALAHFRLNTYGCRAFSLELTAVFAGIQRAALTILGIYLKRICSHNTNASSALGVLSDYTYHSLNTSIHGNWLGWLCRRPGIDIL